MGGDNRRPAFGTSSDVSVREAAAPRALLLHRKTTAGKFPLARITGTSLSPLFLRYSNPARRKQTCWSGSRLTETQKIYYTSIRLGFLALGILTIQDVRVWCKREGPWKGREAFGLAHFGSCRHSAFFGEISRPDFCLPAWPACLASPRLHGWIRVKVLLTDSLRDTCAVLESGRFSSALYREHRGQNERDASRQDGTLIDHRQPVGSAGSRWRRRWRRFRRRIFTTKDGIEVVKLEGPGFVRSI